MGLALRKDNLIIDLDELYLISTDLINAAKREYYIKKECNIDKAEIQDFQRKLGQIKKGLRELLENIRSYIKEIKEYKSVSSY